MANGCSSVDQWRLLPDAEGEERPSDTEDAGYPRWLLEESQRHAERELHHFSFAEDSSGG